VTLVKKGIAVAAVASILILLWFAYSARREERYRATLAHYENELAIGTPRAEVQKYLDSRGVQYLRDFQWVAWQPDGLHSIAITLGPASGNLGCTWTAYLELEFELSNHSIRGDAALSDRLRAIRIRKIGRDCV
jgi:hypothetical protein